jgi:predicted HNH restriction endonuclease
MGTTAEKDLRRLAGIFAKIKPKLTPKQLGDLEMLYRASAGIPIWRDKGRRARGETVASCSRIGTAMFEAMREEPRGDNMMMVGHFTSAKDQEYWVLRPNNRRALKHLGWFERVAPTPDRAPAPDGDNMVGYHRTFDERVRAAMKDTVAARRERLRNAPQYPSYMSVTARVPIRNPDVVAEVLHRAKGRCERCLQPAPFLRAKGGMPYLEVHHRIMLTKGGPDTVDNAVAICPNCHRLLHYGKPKTC